MSSKTITALAQIGQEQSLFWRYQGKARSSNSEDHQSSHVIARDSKTSLK